MKNSSEKEETVNRKGSKKEGERAVKRKEKGSKKKGKGSKRKGKPYERKGKHGSNQKKLR